jgi:hypothetical protein
MVLYGVAVASCLIALLALGDLHAQKPTKTITGVVKSAESHQGKILAVYIMDPSEGDFLVVRSTEMGKELLKHVGSTVRATGYVRKRPQDPKFSQAIDVLQIEVVPLDGPEPDPQGFSRQND